MKATILAALVRGRVVVDSEGGLELIDVSGLKLEICSLFDVLLTRVGLVLFESATRKADRLVAN